MESKKLELSIIMATFNGENCVADAIKSILNQTYKDFEFIIVDDGSNDNTYEIIKKYANSDNRIRIIRNICNIGLAKSLNKAIKQAKGQIIARQDDDDISLPNRLNLQVKFMEKNPNYSFCGCNGIIKQTKQELLKFFEFKDILKNLILENCFYHSTIVIRKDYFERYGAYNEKYLYSQDYELFCRLIYKHKLKAKNLKKKLMIIDLPRLKLLEIKRHKFLIQRKNALKIKIKYLNYTRNKLKGLLSILKYFLEICYVFLFGRLYRKIS